ncbi:unnamed protein product, partial [Rotaria sp. Silwood1]
KIDYKKSKDVFDSRDITETQVLVIGAGISGLEAARLLKQNGVQTLVIEARNRTGGRIWTIQSKNGDIIDLGANSIHGIDGSIPHGFLSNPLWDLVQQAKIPTCTVSLRDMKIFNMINPNIAENLKIWFDEYMNYVEEATKTSSRNQSLQQYAEIFFTVKNFTNELQDAFYSYVRTVIEVNEGTEISTINAKDFVEIAGSFYGLDKVCHDTGYHSIIDNIVKDFRDDDIRFGQIVNKINYDNDLVEVQTVNGHAYRSQYVLITVPLGVLKGRQIMFNPTLPQWKLNSIDRIGNGLLNKVVLVWNKA